MLKNKIDPKETVVVSRTLQEPRTDPTDEDLRRVWSIKVKNQSPAQPCFLSQDEYEKVSIIVPMASFEKKAGAQLPKPKKPKKTSKVVNARFLRREVKVPVDCKIVSMKEEVPN